MISIPYTNVSGGVVMERELTEVEQATVTSRRIVADEVVFYQGDEPEEIPEPESVSMGTALQAFLSASEDEKKIIAQELKPYLDQAE
jgi:hypothetical protein